MPTAWQLSLLPASWRGVPFGVRTGARRAGRRIALHGYPFRDEFYPEDIGRAARTLNITGFVVGDDAGTQIEALLDACEQPGQGTLVHPIYGVLSNRVLASPAETEERWDQGRVIEIRMSFVEAGQVLYPAASVDTPTATQNSVTFATTPVNGANQKAVGDVTFVPPAGISSDFITAPPISTTPSAYSDPLFSANTADLDLQQSAADRLSTDAGAGAPQSVLSQDAAAAAFVGNAQTLGAGP